MISFDFEYIKPISSAEATRMFNEIHQRRVNAIFISGVQNLLPLPGLIR